MKQKLLHSIFFYVIHDFGPSRFPCSIDLFSTTVSSLVTPIKGVPTANKYPVSNCRESSWVTTTQQLETNYKRMQIFRKHLQLWFICVWSWICHTQNSSAWRKNKQILHWLSNYFRFRILLGNVGFLKRQAWILFIWDTNHRKNDRDAPTNIAWENSRHFAMPPQRRFLAKWHLRNERKNSILMTHHYPDVGS